MNYGKFQPLDFRLLGVQPAALRTAFAPESAVWEQDVQPKSVHQTKNVIGIQEELRARESGE